MLSAPNTDDVVALSSANPALPVPALAERALDEMEGAGGTPHPLAALIQVTWLRGSRYFVQRHVTQEWRVICLQFIEHRGTGLTSNRKKRLG